MPDIDREFRGKLTTLINEHSMENGSDTPDFVLANYMALCLVAFDAATVARDKWYMEQRKDLP